MVVPPPQIAVRVQWDDPMKLRENAAMPSLQAPPLLGPESETPEMPTLFPEHEIPGGDDGIDGCSISWVSFLYMKKRLDGQ